MIRRFAMFYEYSISYIILCTKDTTQFSRFIGWIILIERQQTFKCKVIYGLSPALRQAII